MSNGGVTGSARPAEQRPPSQDKSSDLRASIDRQLEEILLRAGPNDHARSGVPLDAVPFGDMFVQHEVTIAKEIAAKRIKGAKLRRAVIETDLSHDIGPTIRRRMDEADLDVRTVVGALGDDGLLDLIQDLPSREIHEHSSDEQASSPAYESAVGTKRLLRCQIALPVPVVYCDVVMTEKQWVDTDEARASRRRIPKPSSYPSRTSSTMPWPRPLLSHWLWRSRSGGIARHQSTSGRDSHAPPAIVHVPDMGVRCVARPLLPRPRACVIPAPFCCQPVGRSVFRAGPGSG